MRSKLDPRWIPVAILLLAAPIVASILITNAALNGGGSGQTSRPTPTPPPITAKGTIGYITSEGNFALMNPDGSNQRVLSSDGTARSVVWAADGSVAAVEVGSPPAGRVRGVRPDGSAAFEVQGATPLWSPAGDKIAVMQNGNVALFDALGSAIRTFPNGELPAWSPDGSRIAFLKLAADGNAVPVIGDVGSGLETPLSPDIVPAQPVYPIAWHPSGQVIAYRNRLYDVVTGNTTDLPGAAVYWSPNGRMLLVAGEFSPADRGTPGLLLDGSQGFKQTIGLMIQQSPQNVAAQLYIQRWTDWTPDGRYLFYLDPEPGRERVRIYDTEKVAQQKHTSIAGERPDISPDGQFAAFMYQNKVWVFPLDGSTLVAVAGGGYPAWKPGS